MIAPTFTVTVDDRALRLHFDQMPTRLRTNLHEAITKLTDQLLAQVRAAEPSRTGQLRSLTRAFVDEGDNFVRGRVRVLAPPGSRHNIAAAALEYGVHRSVRVRAYQRQSFLVRAYERQADIAARRFLRGPAAEMRPKMLEALQTAVDKSVSGAQ
jgi:type IV pilus biogenesis protein CpaD/CtpE